MESLTIKLPSKEYSRIEATVVAMYEKLGIDSVPIDPFNIANRLGFVLRPYSQLPIEKQLQLRKLECEAINFYDPEVHLSFAMMIVSYTRECGLPLCMK